MRLLKYIPKIACAAILLAATFAAAPVFAQAPLAVALANSGGGVIDYGATGYLRIRPSIPAGQGDAHNVAIRGVFTAVATHPLSGAPAATFAGPAAGANGTNCQSPDPATPSNANTFRCDFPSVVSGQPAATGNPYERRIVIAQPAPTQRPPNSACPPAPDGSSTLVEHVGDWVITITGDNITGAPRPPVNFSGHDTEDFADVDVSISGTPATAKVGDTIVQTVTIHNFGPCLAEYLCASNANATALSFQSNSGACTRPYGRCNLANLFAPHAPPTYDETRECGFPQARNPIIGTQVPNVFSPGFLRPGEEFRITSTYIVTADALPGSVTNTGVPNEVDIQALTNLINYGGHTQAAMTQSIISNETSCSVAATGGSSLAMLGLALLAARALRRRRS